MLGQVYHLVTEVACPLTLGLKYVIILFLNVIDVLDLDLAMSNVFTDVFSYEFCV